MNFFVEQGVDASETRSSMSLIKEADGVAKAEHLRLQGTIFVRKYSKLRAVRNVRHRNAGLRRNLRNESRRLQVPGGSPVELRNISSRRMLPSETFVRRWHGSALPDPSRGLSSPSDFNRNDFPRPNST